MANNLLDKASIILTPTAYDNGKALCVKPSDASGDFQFSRNSAATRVNAQGLVENVQILSSNLVQNPSFSEEGVQEVSNGSFSQESSELITNGDFATDSNWAKNPNWTISGGTANCDGTSDGSFFQGSVIQDSKQYLVTYTISNLTQGGLRVQLSGTQGVLRTLNGTYTEYITSGSNPSGRVSFDCSSSPIGSIENCSVREVGQDWVLGGSGLNTATIGSNSATITSVDSNSYIQQNSVLTSGKSYKISYEILSSSGSSVLKMISSLGLATIPTTVGTHTVYGTATTTTFYIERAVIGMNATITNISVKEVGMDWTKNDEWSIGSGVAECDGSNGKKILQNIGLATNKYYEFTIEVKTLTSGAIALFYFNGSYQTVASGLGLGTHTVKFYTSGTVNGSIYINSQSFIGSVTNISVIEITDDTNLPRINYEGFSYQDALGSEKIVNGRFDTDTAWAKNGNVTISGGTANFNNSASGNNVQQPVTLPSGKQYIATYEITSITDGKFSIYVGGVLSGNQNNQVGVYTEVFTSIGVNQVYVRARGTTTGSIDNVSVKEYLGQEVVPNSGCGSWLFEPQSTNVFLQSEPTANEGTSGGVTYESFNWEIGFTNCVKYGDNSAIRFRYGGTVSASTEYTLSAFVIMDDLSEPIIGGQTSDKDFTFVLGGGIFSNANSSVNMGNNIWRVSVTAITSASPNAGNSGIIKFTSQSNKGFRVVGYQLEQQSYATSYIPTSGSTVTRNQDVCNNGGSLATINSTEGTLYFEGAALSNDLTYREIALSDGTTSNRIEIRYGVTNNIIQAVTRSGGVVNGSISISIYNITNFNKIAVRYKLDDVSLWVNGVKIGADLSAIMPINLSELSFDNGAGNDKFFGKTKALAVFPYLSDQELTELTTI